MTTTCRREDDAWILNGEKKWIGNATFADINVIWAREETSNQVKGFVVGKDNRGFSVKKIENKMALRVVQNGLITLKDCRVPERDRLQNANSFKDTAKVLRMTRAGVAWFAVGCAMGAYEHFALCDAAHSVRQANRGLSIGSRSFGAYARQRDGDTVPDAPTRPASKPGSYDR
jgi:alkylation response protein AidB-like acyl-CoA dehydrogenase